MNLFWKSIPRTDKVEQKELDHRNLVQEIKELQASELLREFEALEQEVTSDAFHLRKKEITKMRFKGSEPYELFKEFQRLHKNKKLRRYFEFRDSPEFKGFKKFRDSEHYPKLQDKEAVKANPDLKAYKKLEKSKTFRNYSEIHGAPMLRRYNELLKVVNSEDFIQKREFLEDSNRYDRTPECEKEKRYKELLSQPNLNTYSKLKGTQEFDELNSWEIGFEEDFSGASLNREKWLTSYYWGHKLIKGNYSLHTDGQAYTGEKNLKLGNSILAIETRREDVKSRVWHPVMGFQPRQFKYSSGLINTGDLYRQQYGLLKVKVRVGLDKGITHAVWMASDKTVPHINVFKTVNGKQFSVGNFWGDLNSIKENHEENRGIKLEKDFYIISLYWKKDYLEWRINDVVVHRQSEGIPKEPMYLSFSSIVDEERAGDQASGKLEIDWVRWYKPIAK